MSSGGDVYKSSYIANLLRCSLLMLLPGLLTCCKEENEDPPQPAVENGRFAVAISGGINKDMEGDAYFSHEIIETDPAAGSRLQLTLVDIENAEQISISITVRQQFEGVTPGTYEANASSTEGPFVTIYYTTQTNVDFIATNTGSIQLSERNENSAWGSFTAKLVEIQNQTIEITGDFNAEPFQ